VSDERVLILQRNDAPYLKAMPTDLRGKIVLDVGGYDGYYAARAMERGAEVAKVLDNRQYRRYSSDEAEGWHEPVLFPGVMYITGDLITYHQPAHLVMCFNVIYHVTSPWDAARALRHLTWDTLLLSTSWLAGDEAVWHLTPDASHTIFWTPTVPGLVNLLKAVGFANVEEVERWQDRVLVKAQ
jgi:Protein of unknown function (DUF1698).